jgi:hypothetical protein
MNERIRQLERQAMISVLNGNDPDGDVDRMYISAEFTKKFAELIVRECISMADKESERYSNLDQEYCSMAMDNYRELVRKHFGVEE